MIHIQTSQCLLSVSLSSHIVCVILNTIMNVVVLLLMFYKFVFNCTIRFSIVGHTFFVIVMQYFNGMNKLVFTISSASNSYRKTKFKLFCVYVLCNSVVLQFVYYVVSLYHGISRKVTFHDGNTTSWYSLRK